MLKGWGVATEQGIQDSHAGARSQFEGLEVRSRRGEERLEWQIVFAIAGVMEMERLEWPVKGLDAGEELPALFLA